MSVCVVDCRATPRHVASRAQSVGEESLKKMLSATPLDFSKFNPGAPVRSSSCPCFALPALARSAAAAAMHLLACSTHNSVGWFGWLFVCFFDHADLLSYLRPQRAQMDELLGDAGLQSLLA